MSAELGRPDTVGPMTGGAWTRALDHDGRRSFRLREWNRSSRPLPPRRLGEMVYDS